MTCFDILVNGVDLDRWAVMAGSTYRPPVSVSRSLVEVGSVHGVRSVGLPVYGEPQVVLNLAPGFDARTGVVDQDLADLSALLASPSLVLRRVIEDASRTEEAAADLVSISPGEVPVFGYTHYTAALAIPGVFFRDVAPTDAAVAAGTVAVPTLAGSAPIGDAVVRFAVGASRPSLLDVLSGTGVSVDYVAAATEYVYIDCAELTAWRTSSATQWTPGGTDVSGVVDFPAPGPLQLWPTFDGIDRTLSVTASHAATIRAKRAWL